MIMIILEAIKSSNFTHYIPFQIRNHLISALDDLDGTTNAVGKAKERKKDLRERARGLRKPV